MVQRRGAPAPVVRPTSGRTAGAKRQLLVPSSAWLSSDDASFGTKQPDNWRKPLPLPSLDGRAGAVSQSGARSARTGHAAPRSARFSRPTPTASPLSSRPRPRTAAASAAAGSALVQALLSARDVGVAHREYEPWPEQPPIYIDSSLTADHIRRPRTPRGAPRPHN